MAESVEGALGQHHVEAEIKNVVDVSVNDLTAQHDLLVLDCPAYGDDEIE